MKWMVTAFEPFGGSKSNSSQIALEELKKMEWNGLVEFFEPVPVSYKEAWPVVAETLKRRPHIIGVLGLGQSEKRSKISLERVALNWIDSRSPDNRGLQPPQGPIEEGPECLFSPIPWQHLADSPAWERSYSAGTFVCNAFLYQMLRSGKVMSGFVHVPLLESQVDLVYDGLPKQKDVEVVRNLAIILKFLTSLV